MNTPVIPKIISVDDHVVEPPHVWRAWLPARFRDRGPRVERRRWPACATSAAATTSRPSTTTRPTAPTAGCTRTWSTCTSATSPWATHVTR